MNRIRITAITLLALLGAGLAAEPINESFLTSSHYRQPGAWAWAIAFNAGAKTYYEYFEGEGCGGYEGTYRIEGDYVILKPEKGECTPKSPMPVRKCELSPAFDHLDYTMFLSCGEGESYAREESKVPAGEKREVYGRQVIMMGRAKGRITTGAKIRSDPGLTAPSYVCSYDNPFMGYNPPHVKPVDLPYLRENTYLTILARLPEKSQVQKWTNYWYYVRPSFGMADGCKENGQFRAEGWVFGEFIKFD